MRICHVYRTARPFTFGGVEEIIHELATAHAAQGHSCTVVTIHPGRDVVRMNHAGYEVVAFPRSFEIASNSVSLRAIAAFRSIVADCDIINYHFPWPFMDLLHFAANVRVPAVLTYHSDIIRQQNLALLYEPLRRAFFSRMRAVVATSPNYRRTSPVLRKLGDKVLIIPPGVSDRASLHREAMMASACPERFFLFVGVLRYYKGLETLIEAARRTGFPVLIAGDGPLASRLERAASGLPHVTFLGQVSDAEKDALLRAALAVVLPSDQRSEALGVTLIEGSMFGKPLISCEIGTGTSFVNQSGRTGLVVPPDDPDALAQAMGLLWRNDGTARALGDAARQRYCETFTSGAMATSYLDLYRSVAGEERQC